MLSWDFQNLQNSQVWFPLLYMDTLQYQNMINLLTFFEYHKSRILIACPSYNVLVKVCFYIVRYSSIRPLKTLDTSPLEYTVICSILIRDRASNDIQRYQAVSTMLLHLELCFYFVERPTILVRHLYTK